MLSDLDYREHQPPEEDGVEGILEQIGQENLDVYKVSPARLQEDVSQEAQVAQDYRGRLIYELLQNADDALGGTALTGNRVLLRLTDAELWVANTGRPFSGADVRGLCGLGASSKAGFGGPKRASIGHKGLGFKSVLEVSDAPEAYSDTVSFQLGKQHARSAIEMLWSEHGRGQVRDVPAMRFPSGRFVHAPGWHELQVSGYHGAFRFPFKSGTTVKQREQLAEQLLTLPMTTVLFLKHIEEVVIEVDTASRQESRQWLLERSRLRDSGQTERCAGLTVPGLYAVDLLGPDGQDSRYLIAHDSEVSIGGHRNGLSGPAWEGVEVSEVSVAVLDAEDPRLPLDDRHFHVFLPTQEPAACSLLVNGAFATDLSRKHVQISGTDDDYNAHLVRRAAEVFDQLLRPYLLRERDARFILRALEQPSEVSGDAARRFRVELIRVLADAPILPSATGLRGFALSVLPSPVLGDGGRDFARLLSTEFTLDGRTFPDAEYCVGEFASVCADYGALALTPAQTLKVLAEAADPERTRARLEPGSRFSVDPMLEVCTALWERVDFGDRDELKQEARRQSIFPTKVDLSGTIVRIVLGQEIAFYPPRSTSDDPRLARLAFLAHDICWGTLKRTEQGGVLERQLTAWSALFDIKDFRFEEVMRAAVLPGLAKVPDVQLRDANRSFEALAAICALAGKTTKPEQPLPMGRLGSDRAFFNMSRLDVPCRGSNEGEIVWVPAHQVYFGVDWVGEDSVEELSDAMADSGTPLGLHYLAPPSSFQRFSSRLVQPENASDASLDDLGDEVDLEDDTDEALETTVEDRWRHFFAWLGVSRGLRLIHFHDVDDEEGWTTTKGLGLPSGSAFEGLEDVWGQYVDGISDLLSRDERWDGSDHYLYNVRTLDHLGKIAPAAQSADHVVGEALFKHLARNWGTYSRFSQAEVALVDKGKYPSQRSKPAQAWPNERTAAGPDFWLARLRNRAFCPTSQGPRMPGQTWRNSDELRRRLGTRGHRAQDLVPVLKSVDGVSDAALRPLLDALQVRGEFVPAAFTVDDARQLAERIAVVYGDPLNDADLRALRPVYRQLFELLVGAPKHEVGVLRDVPMAARTLGGIKFLPAKDVIYANVAGSRERSGVQQRLNTFVIEAEPSALRPLRDLFGMPLLENALTWSVRPFDSSLDVHGVQEFHAGLRELAPSLLARLGADRADQSGTDRTNLREFVNHVDPVSRLALRVSLEGEDLGEVTNRDYFVRRSVTDDGKGTRLEAYVVWSSTSWPPLAEDAQTLAMALADALEVNTVETFLSFISANEAQRRKLLDLAGAAEQFDGMQYDPDSAAEELDVHDNDETVNTSGAATDGVSAEPESRSSDTHPPASGKSEPQKVPLYRFDQLLFDGELLRVAGAAPRRNRGHRQDGTNDESDSMKTVPNEGAPRAASGTDRSELDRLGMLITIAFERRRLGGARVAVLPGDEPPGDCRNLIVDVSEPAMIDEAKNQAPLVQAAFAELTAAGFSSLFPGFDILTIVDGQIDRMIELKSSGFDAQVQEMSWNEWKTARGSFRHNFWLYLVGNLRADLQDATPFVRAVQDPFGALESSEAESTLRKRTMQLRVREFAAADELKIEVRQSKQLLADQEDGE